MIQGLSAPPWKRLWATAPVAVFLVAVGLNFPWELLQCRLYIMPPGATSFWWHCFRASLGDAFIVLLVWAVGWLTFKRPDWFETPEFRGYGVMIAGGLLIGSGVEWVSVHILHRWAYGPEMPVVPGLRIGVLPMLQLALLSPLVFWSAALITRRARSG